MVTDHAVKIHFSMKRHMTSIVNVLGAGGALVVCYWLAPLLPDSVGWEGGLLENLQILLLLVGGMLVFWYRSHTQNTQFRWFWLMIVPIWLMLSAREMSWGVVFLPPVSTLSTGEPIFSARQQLWFYPAVKPILLTVTLACVVIGVITAQHLLVRWLWRRGYFPMREIFIAVMCLLLAAISEGKLGLKIGYMDKGAAQNFEELAEFIAFLFVLIGQHRVWRGLTKR